MRKVCIIAICVFLSALSANAQTIPFGNSMDSFMTSIGEQYDLYFYKPATYDSVNSPIIWALHGTGGSGSGMRNLMITIADNRNAMVISGTNLVAGFGYLGIDTLQNNEGEDSIIMQWAPPIFKEIYQYVLARENRDSIWVYLTGFSAGGQGVTRYMLIRQAFYDSIPIRMAVSVSPCSYTFLTDSFNNVCMPWPCGLGTAMFPMFGLPDVDFVCDEQAIQYYNENYAILIGTADNGCGGGFGGCQCIDAEGAGRYARAQNFYAFSDTDAVARGTTLKWQYKEIAGVGHNGWDMYHTLQDTADTASIAETLLFDSPYYQPMFLPPSADLYYEVSPEYCSEVSFVAQCAWNKEPVTVLWDFGDATTSNEIRPVHTYAAPGTYSVTLIVSNILGGDTAVVNVTIDTLPPVADFDSDTIAYLPNATVQFTNTSVGAYFYYWDFGDSTTTNDMNPVHTYLTADTFTVELIAVSDITGCANRITKDIIVRTGTGMDEQNLVAVRVYPNPFNETTSISFVVSESGFVKLEVYNYLGQRVALLFDGVVNGRQQYSVNFRSDELAEGMYFLRLKTGTEQRTSKLLIAK